MAAAMALGLLKEEIEMQGPVQMWLPQLMLGGSEPRKRQNIREVSSISHSISSWVSRDSLLPEVIDFRRKRDIIKLDVFIEERKRRKCS